MIAYFGTSAVVPLLIAESGSARAAALWVGADRVVSVRLIYPETRAALALAERLGRLTARQLRDAVTEFDSLFEEIDLVEVDDALAHRAGELAEGRQLRGYDMEAELNRLAPVWPGATVAVVSPCSPVVS